MNKILACALVVCGLLPTLGHAATDKLNFLTAWCDGNTPYSAWDVQSTGGMGKACVVGTGVRYGVLTAPDGSSTTAYYHFRWPSDFVPTGQVNVVVEYTGSIIGPAANIRTAVQFACVADGGGTGQDMLAPSYNSAVGLSTPGPVTLGAKGSVSFTNVNVANCAAGEHAFLRLVRNGADTTDTYTGDARYLNIEVTYTRQ